MKDNNNNNINKVEERAKTFKTITSLLAVIATMIYGLCIFIYQSQTNTREISDLKNKTSELETKLIQFQADANNKHHEIKQKIADNEKDFQMTSTKLEVSLTRIAADLQFIKEHLMEKGMNGKR